MTITTEQLERVQTAHAKIKTNIPAEIDFGFRRFPLDIDRADNFVILLNTAAVALAAAAFATEEDDSYKLVLASLILNGLVVVYNITAVNLRANKNLAYVNLVSEQHPQLVGTDAIGLMLPTALIILGFVGLLGIIAAATLFALKISQTIPNVVAIVIPFLIQVIAGFAQQKYEAKNANLLQTINTMIILKEIDSDTISVAIQATPFTRRLTSSTLRTPPTPTTPLISHAESGHANP